MLLSRLAGARGRFRHWRRTRPFWAGVLVLAAGAEILFFPLAPLPIMLHIGTAAVTGIAIGLILMVAGVFFWFAPQQRTFISIVTAICSVLSVVTSNLGGFVIGLLLGLLGSSMAFGWRPRPPEPGERDPAPRRPSPVPRGRGGRANLVLLLAMLLGLSTVVSLGGENRASARAAASSVLAAPGITRVLCDRLDATGLTIRGSVSLPTSAGSERALLLHIGHATLRGYRLRSPGPAAASISTDLEIADIDLYTTRFTASILVPGLELPLPPITLTPALIPVRLPIGVPIPALSATAVDYEQPLIVGGTVRLTGRLAATR